MFEWEENSGLYSVSPYTPPRDIFLAVCGEIGRHYQGTELKYSKSKRELKWRGEHLWCKLGFWSSRGNLAGSWVNLEIVTSLFASDLSGMERKGVLSFSIRPKNFNVYRIDRERFGEIIRFIDGTLEAVRRLDTRDGLEAWLSTVPRRSWMEKSPNHRQYLSRLGLES